MFFSDSCLWYQAYNCSLFTYRIKCTCSPIFTCCVILHIMISIFWFRQFISVHDLSSLFLSSLSLVWYFVLGPTFNILSCSYQGQTGGRCCIGWPDFLSETDIQTHTHTHTHADTERGGDRHADRERLSQKEKRPRDDESGKEEMWKKEWKTSWRNSNRQKWIKNV